MSLAAEPITEHPCHSELTIEFGKTAHNRGKRASYTRGIHHEHYRRIQPFCDFSGRTLLADGGGSVEQPHHPFNQGDIRVRTSAGKGAEHRLPPHHPAVKVVASTSSSPDMVGWIKVIGSTFKDRDLKPSLAQRTRETNHYTGLADSTCGATDDQARDGDRVRHPRLHPFLRAWIADQIALADSLANRTRKFVSAWPGRISRHVL